MIDLMEKLVEGDFEDLFKPASKDELDGRIEGMDEDELKDFAQDIFFRSEDYSGQRRLYNKWADHPALVVSPHYHGAGFYEKVQSLIHDLWGEELRTFISEIQELAGSE